ncbi:MAG: hypothetical protein ACT4P3_21305 [Betaproteobacteria bacterium]
MKRLIPFLAALCLAAPAFAQAPKADTPKPERREAFRQAHEKARKACEGKSGDEARDCMRREMCAQSQDPAACEARAKQRAERRAGLREACKDKKGEELKACIREHRSKTK